MPTEMDHFRQELDDQLKDSHRSVFGGRSDSFRDKMDRDYVSRQNRSHGTSFSTDTYRGLRDLGVGDPWAPSSSSSSSSRSGRTSSSRSSGSSSFRSSFSSSSGGSSSRSGGSSSSFGTSFGSSDDSWPPPPPSSTFSDDEFHAAVHSFRSSEQLPALMPPPPNFSGVSPGFAGQHMRLVTSDEIYHWKVNDQHLTGEQYKPYTFEKPTPKPTPKPKVEESPGKIFVRKFGESLTQDMFKNGLPDDPVSAATAIISAVVDACDVIERSDTENAIREAMSHIPVIAQLELLERAAEIDYARTMERVHADTASYMEQGYTKKAATAMAVFDNDFVGDTCPIAVSTIVEKEMGKDFKPKPKTK